MKYIIPPFEEVFSIENLFRAWKEFQRGKKYKKDVAEFSMSLYHNLFALGEEILSGKYKHDRYFHFKITDPKSRDIHKASVRDRIVHHALYNALYPYFDEKFIHDSYSCRIGKGTHKAINRFENFTRKESQNYKRTVWILKCDIRKCFASVNHKILKSILQVHISDKKLFNVLETIIDSYSSVYVMAEIKDSGIPLGNLTSQLFVNIYLHELDLYIKHKIKAKKYIRYADDFAIISQNKDDLLHFISLIKFFLKTKLDFDFHSKKVFIKKFSSGVDFLGWIHFYKYRVLRTITKKKMFRNLRSRSLDNIGNSLNSYLGLLKYGNTHKLTEMLLLKYGRSACIKN